ncbi:hypothetical protein L1987_27737 [Smallanthus sonchifolius]|uniref:Uncharacterized protein n=1 Tax=Smallanthus sonchifolius TaxID=185202 RepID=A0ACB9ICK9_9ASTR|nr:hypothetical protein L1987_27737 [Smallanthus sonchifolius]
MPISMVVGYDDEFDRFPIGMRVLAVDDNPPCLKLLEVLLSKFQYQVTTTNNARTTLKMLRENQNRFDLVISDVYMPDMDGFKLLELVGLEMDLPIIMGYDDEFDRFPIGVRVLAVDDNPPCLKLLEVLLSKCQYQVTTKNNARTALKTLRENQNRFDLVINDVYMPDMDGFKLVELVGLEMDLPVIMLSVDGNPKLSKPNNNQERPNNEGGQETGSGDPNGKLNRKRKDDEDVEDNRNKDDDPSTQKKPRVVWSIDLHTKFVDVVNQLGIEKAVPKKILEQMNVEAPPPNGQLQQSYGQYSSNAFSMLAATAPPPNGDGLSGLVSQSNDQEHDPSMMIDGETVQF